MVGGVDSGAAPREVLTEEGSERLVERGDFERLPAPQPVRWVADRSAEFAAGV